MSKGDKNATEQTFFEYIENFLARGEDINVS
jgi:hypothetical protein